MHDNIRDLILQAIDQTISAEGFDQLQEAIEQSEEARVEYLRAVNLHETLVDIAIQETASAEPSDAQALSPVMLAKRLKEATQWDARSPRLVSLALVTLALVGGIAFSFGRSKAPKTPPWIAGSDERPASEEHAENDINEHPESLIAGHATLRRSVDLEWAADAVSYREGDVLPRGQLQFSKGVAEIDFFCGATLIIEAPATLNVESDWSVRVLEGRLRANVPPAARGFVVKADDSEIVDLGTEFALEVSSDVSHVEVIDGEVELRGGLHDGRRLLTGEGESLKGSPSQPDRFAGLSTLRELRRRRADAESQRIADWKTHSQQLSKDERLIAYYPIAELTAGRVVPNAALSGNILDGTLVGPVTWSTGRFGQESRGLEFGRPGARVRTRIDGEFQAFTFACWARIDSLEHRYNALFMGDGYENGEPHWQIRDDGRLMFSVMVDDTVNIEHFDKTEQRVVTTAGLHRVYFTEPFWDVSNSGQWFHIAAVYDPTSRQVNQFVNGRQISSEEIVDRYHTSTLHIGPAEIGNWGQPFRKSPWFAVRNLNGTIDELAIFDAALESDEIQEFYQQGKPLSY